MGFLSPKKAARSFLAALSFYTQLPVLWGNIIITEDDLKDSSRFFPLVGWITGGISGIVFLILYALINAPAAIALSMAASAFITGAMHEDGFADTLDAFGGGYTRDRVFDIMKDSGMGAYGVVGIVLILLVKFSALNALPPASVFFSLLAAHSVSRFAAISFMHTHTYAQKDHLSKIKSAVNNMTFQEFCFAGLTGLFPLLFFGLDRFIIVLIPVLLIRYIMGAYFTKRIGGYTGDCLGAVQQVTEASIYLSLGSLL